MPTFDISPTLGAITTRNAATIKVSMPFGICEFINDGGLQANADDLWNNNLCGNDQEFYRPVQAGDKIYVMFNLPDFRNTDPTNPTDGWREDATVGDAWYVTMDVRRPEGGGALGNINNYSSDYGVAWLNVSGSYQIAVLDVDQIIAGGLTEFSYVVSYKLADGTTTQFFSEPFRVTCEDSFLIEGNYPSGNQDCFNFVYGDLSSTTFRGQGKLLVQQGTPVYRNLTRVVGEVCYNGSTEERERNFNRNTSRVIITDNFQVRGGELVAKWFARKFNKQLLGAESVVINNDETYTTLNLSGKNNEASRNFHIIAEIGQECERAFGC